jgi:trehalose/maltose hydrolase-like predicted phosphorylase
MLKFYTFIKINTMEKLFDITEKLHDLYLSILLNTSEEQLLVVPETHNNNLFWNIAHALVTEQALIYKLSNLEPRLDEALIAKYMKGTYPEAVVVSEEVQKIADALPLTPKWIREDYENGIFKEFNTYTTSARVTLKSVEDAIQFNLVHLGLHFGTLLSMQKLVKATA